MLTESERAELAKRLRKGRQNVVSRIPPRPAGMTELPLSFGQEQLWFIDQFAPGLPTYNIPLALMLSGPVDPDALARAVDALIGRHEPLRSRLLASADGRPVQVIDPAPEKALVRVDLSGLVPDERKSRMREFFETEAARPFTLAEGPLTRTWLLALSPDEHMLMAVIHHTVFDGWSIGLFIRELAALYAAEVTGEPSGLAELRVQYADYALWQRERLQGAGLAELEDYWRRTLTGFQTLQFPTDRPRPVLDNFDGGLVQREVDLALLENLRELSRQQGTTLFVVLMAGLLVLLRRYTGQTDLVIGTASANRDKPDLAPLIGFLVNALPVRASLSGDPPFTELIGRVKDATTAAYAHQELPFGKLVEILEVERDPSRAPVFQIAMNFATREEDQLSVAGVKFAVPPDDLITEISSAKFDFDFYMEARTSGLGLTCSYKTRLFDQGTIERLLANLETLLRGAAASPSTRLSRLPVLTPAELHRELTEWNDTAAQFPVWCVHEAFEAQTARTPDATAAQFELAPAADQRLTYAQLNAKANQIARRLRAAGTGPEKLTGVCMATGLDRLAAVLGIWKAGGGYVPLDPGLPADRLSFLIGDTAMSVIITDDVSKVSLPGTGEDGTGGQITLINLDAERDAIGALDAGNLTGTEVTPENVAYVIYTSGSTGEPKGVMVEHRHAVNFLQGMVAPWRIGPGSVILAFAAFTFDVSVCDMFLPLLAGGTVLLAAPETLHSPQRLSALMRDGGVTYAMLPPAVLSLLNGQDFPALRTLISTGEELVSELVRPWLRDGLDFWNGYGPTEATLGSTFMKIGPATPLPPPIGRPKPNYQAYVLDPDLNPVPTGVVGELHIGGAGVSRGYLNRPELTREKFIPDPFSARPGARLYKTGDLVRRRPDGTLVFLGRIDTQVKIRGLRVELGEIETALAAHPAVAHAAVTVIADAAGEPQLAGYVRAEPGGNAGTELDLAELRSHLTGQLPGYMVPTYLTAVEEFPLNANGKIDKAALPPPRAQPQDEDRYVAPATPLETSLAGLFASVLGLQQVGATDNFFDIGGSSLQVMRLVDQIAGQTGADLGISAVFLHPTPRQLAASIEAAGNESRPAGAGSLVPLSDGPGELPLVVIHAIGGAVFAYAQLARELAGDYQVLGLEAPGLRDASAIAPGISELADDYTARIRAAQPDGPYRLAGWSMGGVIAFEVARRLEQAGHQVAQLVLLDAPYAQPRGEELTESLLAGLFVADATASMGMDSSGQGGGAASRPDPASATVDEQLGWLAGQVGADGDDDVDPADRAVLTRQLRQRLALFSAHARMLAGYAPAEYAVRAATLVVSADDSPNARFRDDWPKALAGPVTVWRVASDHYALLRPPVVAEVAKAVLAWQAERG